jgi:taurine dioxygenase
MEFRPLHPDFGAEVIGFDLQHGRAAADIAALQAAYAAHSMLLFRGGGRISPERHVEIASWFGPPGPVDNSGQGDFVSVLHNRDAAGSMQLPFHCDLTYTDCPIKAICLHAIELPGAPTSTTFVNNFNAWKRLSPQRQAQLEHLTLRHLYVSRMPEYNWPDFIADHPLRMPHPRSGQSLLMITEHHAERINELDEAESAALIADLLAHAYTPHMQYEHVWQLHDLLMWDNLANQHARREKSDFAGGPRALQRVAMAEMGLPELIERARARQAA